MRIKGYRNGYLMTRRIERAMAMLDGGDLSLTEVCFAVGCSSLGTFSTRFAELVGMPPSTYRRQSARATAGMPSCVAKPVSRPMMRADFDLITGLLGRPATLHVAGLPGHAGLGRHHPV
jgi:hypothetical protein